MPQDDFDVITGPSVERHARELSQERNPRQATEPEREAEQKAG
jgi:hypothetical protein